MTEAATDTVGDVKISANPSACKFVNEIGCIGDSAAGNCRIDSCNSVIEAEEWVATGVVVSTTLSICICVEVTSSVASIDSNSGIIHAIKGSDAISPEIPDDGFGTDTDGMGDKLDKPVEVTEVPIPANPSGAEGLAKHFKSIINLYKYVSLFLLGDFLHLLFIALCDCCFLLLDLPMAINSTPALQLVHYDWIGALRLAAL